MKAKDNVNRPSHYRKGKVECIDAIKSATGDGYQFYLQGNVIKYMWRFNHKNGLEDLQKAQWYLSELIKIKKKGAIHECLYASHPFSVVGWDGYNYPYKFSIHDFEPITGRVHQPPPVHQTFETSSFVICSFVPRLYDYHPDAIPAPYHHSNIDSDELLYYVDGDFMSRNDIEPGDITLHPGGIPHGPHPGAIERSIGQKDTQELAVMIDPFKPVQITEAAMEIAREEYYLSWDERNKLVHA